jgi:hypothetical protein
MSNDNPSVEQEIKWLTEEIEMDEALRGTSSFPDVESRLNENREKLRQLQEEQNG